MSDKEILAAARRLAAAERARMSIVEGSLGPGTDGAAVSSIAADRDAAIRAVVEAVDEFGEAESRVATEGIRLRERDVATWTIDLDAIEARYRAIGVWSRAITSADDVPDLLYEVRRLSRLLAAIEDTSKPLPEVTVATERSVRRFGPQTYPCPEIAGVGAGFYHGCRCCAQRDHDGIHAITQSSVVVYEWSTLTKEGDPNSKF